MSARGGPVGERAASSAGRRSDVGPPAVTADERTTLLAFLDYLRAAVVAKVVDVPEPAVRTPGVASGTSLLGTLKHLGHVERFYFLGEPIAQLRRTLRPTGAETVDGLVASYRDAVVRANAAAQGWTDLDAPAPRAAGRGGAPTRRWVLVHMIEETARHAGQLDVLREQLDGATGR
ncbi:DinB family protein [Cellulomonas iranensis]|uniref:DinB family protein n=1 Tax=Cellulomonas iranensis TaxID=76862 RepID=UPI001C4FA3EC|nr:DinB family protein [Cellulomonas iranensis]